MNRSGLRILLQPFLARTQLAQQVRNVRSHSITVSNIAPVSGYCGTRMLEKLQDSLSAAHGTIRHYGDQCAKNKFEPSQIDPRLKATYDDIVALPKHPEVLLIDVRPPSELAASGAIPTSINIPLKHVVEELKLSPKEFEGKYGRTMPATDSPIIFCCRIGVRSGKAAHIAEQLGFTNVKNYVGSWSEYAEKNNLPQMNLNGLRTVAQRFRAGSRLVHNARNGRSYSVVSVSNIAPVSVYRGIRSVDQLQGYPTTIRGTTRCYSDKCDDNKFDPSCIDLTLLASYDDIVALPKHPEVLLIDVRRPDELAGTGTIPTSINIPLSIVGEELKLSPKEFESKYGRTKPAADSPLIFSCRSGVRAGEAANIASKLGFTNVKNYAGSWLEYAEKNGLPLEPQENKFY
ncbi:uncharacterized protein LOC135710530 [Ochlerotatus camptorhynchus]|uniref:uncharacterized protein LOC135710530 n=1 Tax=Ochlerotatus camptorhynchus TaxID=644619 RepID=UPI0031E2C0C8